MGYKTSIFSWYSQLPLPKFFLLFFKINLRFIKMCFIICYDEYVLSTVIFAIMNFGLWWSWQFHQRWTALRETRTNRKIKGRHLYWNSKAKHCEKSVHILSFSGSHFLAFGLNTEIYRINIRIQFKYGKIKTRKTPNADTFCAVKVTHL